MFFVSEQRSYKSPLREQQAKATREQILIALVDLVTDHGPHDLNIKDLATRANVSERTVYRHFPDRSALLDGLFDYLDEHADWMSPSDIHGPADLSRAVTEGWPKYDLAERETRALVLMNFDPARTATRSQQHVELFRGLIADGFPALDDRDVAGVAALYGLLASSRSWLRMLDGYGLSGTESSHYVGWLIDLMARELESGAEIPRPDDEQTP